VERPKGVLAMWGRGGDLTSDLDGALIVTQVPTRIPDPAGAARGVPARCSASAALQHRQATHLRSHPD